LTRWRVSHGRLKFCLPALAVLCSFGCKPPEESLQKAIIGAVLIDGSGGPPLSNSVVIVAGDRIRAVGNRANMPIPAGVEKINGMGKFLVPGLIDLDADLGSAADRVRERIERNLNTFLYFGVTSVRGMGTGSQAALEVRKAERDDQLSTARLFILGGVFSPQKLGDVVVQSDSPEDARRQVDALARQQVDGIAIWADNLGGKGPKIKPAVADAILDQARKYDLPVTAQIYSLADTERLVQSGAAGFVHMIRDTEDIDPAFVSRLRDLRIVFAPALVWQEVPWLFAEHPELLDSPDVIRSVDAAAIAAARQAARAGRATPTERIEFERAKRNTARLAAAGVLIGVASEGGSGLDFPGLTTHREIELLVESGLSPMDAIVAATRNGALALRKTEELGVIEPGRRADLMLISDNPLEDVRNLRKIDRLMLNGEWVDREHLVLK
jgi:imidazolonepropionase-like amidohydrolase